MNIPSTPARITDEAWQQDMRMRLRQELDDLYNVIDESDMGARQRIGQILRAFDLMETGEYGVCTCCAVPIRRERLEADPVRDTCETCGQQVIAARAQF